MPPPPCNLTTENRLRPLILAPRKKYLTKYPELGFFPQGSPKPILVQGCQGFQLHMNPTTSSTARADAEGSTSRNSQTRAWQS